MTRTARNTLLMAVVLLLPVLLLSGCSQPQSKVPGIGSAPAETTSAAVFFSTGRTLVEEPRVVDLNKRYEAALQEYLLATPELFTTIAIVQPTAKFKSVTFKDGVVTVDWTKDILAFDAEPGEKRLALAGILATLGEFNEVKKVKFTVEGKDSGTIDGKNVEDFWGAISLKGQPWKAIHVASTDESGTTVGDSPLAPK